MPNASPALVRQPNYASDSSQGRTLVDACGLLRTFLRGRSCDRRGPEERLNDLEPLWRALYEHHNEVTPHLRARVRPFERAWESRRRTESTWLQSEPDSFVLAAQDRARYVGYAFVRVRSSAGFAESWSMSDPLADLAFLSVLPELRGRGIGSALMDAAESRLEEMGIADMAIVVIATNTEAIPFYERRGAVPFVTQFIQRLEPEP
jgi:ribosomal protein S18 acetylase RimI-like enzyme